MRLLSLTLLLALGVGTKAETTQKDSIQTIKGVEITARLTQREIVPAQSLKNADLQRLNSQSVADALRYFSGIQLKDYGGVGGIKTVDIRSMGTHHLGIFYDGIELGNAQNGQIDLGQFSLDNIDEISLYNGQKSAIFQPASDFGNAGSVYIRTRKPRFTDGKNYNVKLKVKYGSSDLVRLSALWEQRLSSAVSTSLNAEHLTSSGKYKFNYRRVTPSGVVAYDTTAVRQNGDIRADRIDFNVNGILQRGYWNTKVYFYNSQRGIPGAIVNNVWRRGERQSDLNFFVQNRFQKDITDRFSTQWLAKYAFYRTHYVNKDTTQLPADNRFWQQEFYLSTSNAYEILPNWSISASYDFRWNKLNADTYRFVFPTRFSNMISLATAFETRFIRIQGSVLASFIHDKLHPTTRLMPGMKATDNITKFTPALFIDFPIIDKATNGASTKLSVRTFAKRSFRMPTFNDLYYTDLGNSNLKPESATQYDLGVVFNKQYNGHLLKNVQFQADGYYNTIHDKIIAYPKGQQFRWTMLNLGRVHITGIDVMGAIALQPINDLVVTARLQYTYQDARDVTNASDVFYKDQIPYIPYNSGSAIVNLAYRNWTFNYSFIYSGKRYNQQENIPNNYMQPWYTSDVSLQYDFKAFGTKCRAMLEVNNILNQKYDVILNYPMPGINGLVGLQVEL
ncbi:TonB-dependent receptor [Prevotella pallens]|uniref:TonB-dependent receptor n=1 Tax=Prevotella pallens TaxID=60133 RepID=UPI001CB4A67E|nr:TonB-dependent receptor [Prevotella pallens]MBF1465757.1 TonB-dependent receptor [Prevotella pallens]MBF1472157.1 TonB-dependent receptor [Prevotella pallens]